MSPEGTQSEGIQQASPANVAMNVFASFGLGTLLGIVVGLSTTPVVAGVVTALTSLLGAFLAFESAGDSKGAARVRFNAVRIGSFGLATVLGLILGLYIRISNPFSEDPQAQFGRWEKVLPDNKPLARQMAVYERTGIMPSALNFSPAVATAVTVNADQGKTRLAALFSAGDNKTLCETLDLSRLSTDPKEMLNSYDAYNPQVFGPVTKTIRGLHADHQVDALKAVHSMVCAFEKEFKK